MTHKTKKTQKTIETLTHKEDSGDTFGSSFCFTVRMSECNHWLHKSAGLTTW